MICIIQQYPYNTPSNRVVKPSERLARRLTENNGAASSSAHLWWWHSPRHAFGTPGWKSLAAKPPAFCRNRASLWRGRSGQGLSAGRKTKLCSWVGQFQTCLEGDICQVQMRAMKLVSCHLWKYSPLLFNFFFRGGVRIYIHTHLYIHQIISLIEPNFSL